MNVRIRNSLFVFGWMLLLMAYWEFTYRNAPAVTDLESLLFMVSVGTEYSSVQLHGTVLAWVYMCILHYIYNNYNLYFMIRGSRKKCFARWLYKMLAYAFLYVLLYIAAQEICVYLRTGGEYIQWEYVIHELVYFFTLYIVYLFVGAIFVLVYSCLFPNKKALVISFALVSIVYVISYEIGQQRVPYITLCIAEDIFREFNPQKIFFVVASDVLITLVLLVLAYGIWERKDILENAD